MRASEVRFRDEASTCLFRTVIPETKGPLADLALLFFFARFDVDIRFGRAKLERMETP